MLSACPIALKENAMSTTKTPRGVEIQADGSMNEKIMRELAFDRMVARGLEDVRAGRVVDNEEMQKLIRQWSVAQKKSRIGLS